MKKIQIYTTIKNNAIHICPLCNFCGIDNEDIKLISQEGACSDCLTDYEKMKILTKNKNK